MNTNEKIIIYQVFTRLFGNNTMKCKANGAIEENGCGKLADFTTKALSEIKKLGLNMLLKPITAVMVYVLTILR